MRVWLPFLSLLSIGVIPSCKKDEPAPPPERQVSYSREIRPILAAKCAACHADPENDNNFHLSLSNPEIPDTFSLPHPEEGGFDNDEEALFAKWITQGAQVDPHWAFAPLSDGDDLIIPEKSTYLPVDLPEGDFRAHLRNTLAGDLLPDGRKTAFTHALRKGDDTPAGRLNQLSNWIGIPLLSPNPGEEISNSDHARLLHLFTTPYDHLHVTHPLHPPTYIAGEITPPEEEELLVPVTEVEFKTWLGDRDTLPQIPDLVSIFSFNGGTNRNTALGREDTGATPIPTVDGVQGKGTPAHLPLELPTDLRLFSTSPFSLSLWIKTPDPKATFSLISQKQEGRGFDFSLNNGRIAARFTRYWPGNALAVSTPPLVISTDWQHLAVTYDGSRTSRGFTFYLNGSLADGLLIDANSLVKSIWANSPPPPLTLGDPLAKGVVIDEVNLFQRALSPIEISTLCNGRTLLATFDDPEADPSQLRPYYRGAINPAYRIYQATLLEKRRHLVTLEDQLTEIPVMESLPRAVAPATPRTSGPKCLDAVDRLGLVTTLIGEDSNLLARAAANWLWTEHFGTPLVPSLGYTGTDLSAAGQLTTLAAKLVELDWDLSRLSAFLRQPQ
ncbi:MAG: LamG-like jellyroll fold domain-containing protein [Verrucomicrobiaceae bacterium]